MTLAEELIERMIFLPGGSKSFPGAKSYIRTEKLVGKAADTLVKVITSLEDAESALKAAKFKDKGNTAQAKKDLAKLKKYLDAVGKAWKALDTMADDLYPAYEE